jgi:hypothetical protein
MERAMSGERNVRVRIFDPDRGFARAQSEGYYSEREAMVLFWAQAITPNAPMAVQIEAPANPGENNLHLIRTGLTLKDVPLSLHNDVARWIAEDILEWLSWSCGKEPGTADRDS